MGKGWMLAALVCTLPLSAESNDWHSDTLSVSGNGKATVEANIAEVELGVELQGPTAVDVQKSVAKRVEPVLAVLRKQQAEKVETSYYSVYPLYSKDDTSVITGYRGYQTISFRASSAQAGRMLDQAVQAGANKVQNIQLIAGEEQRLAAKKNALIAATQDAMQQADVVLQALGLRKEHIVRVDVDPNQQPVFRTMAFKADYASMNAPSTEITPQEQEVQASVTLYIRFE